MALLAALGVMAMAASVAGAGVFFNGTITSSPGQDGCYLAWADADNHAAGCAWSGWSGWSYVTLDKVSGDRVALGMVDPCPNCFYVDGSNFYTYGSAGNGQAFTLTRSYLHIGSYNYGFCAYWSGSNSAIECITSK